MQMSIARLLIFHSCENGADEFAVVAMIAYGSDFGRLDSMACGSKLVRGGG